MKQLSKIWVSKEAHNQLRIEAANSGRGLTETADDIIFGKKEKGKGGFRFENNFF